MAPPENCIDNATSTAELGMTIGEPLPALLLQRYRRDRKLGRGGMGVVYRYYDERLDRFLAVKALTAEYASNQQWRERFLREAKTVASLAHHNIGALYDLVEFDGAAFLLLEFVPGRTLAEELGGKPLPLDRALSIALQVGQAIEAGHAAGVIHGDIKPGNIMITPGDVAKVLDYGLAQHRAMEAGESASVANVDTADISALIVPPYGMGTPGYMSPEQIYGGHVGRAADVWAWGCVLFECLTGQPAFPGSTRQDRLAATLNSVPAYQHLPANVPDEIANLLTRCLHKDPDQRAKQIGEVIAALRQAIQTPSQSRATFTPPNNIPEPFSSFVDRSGEMDALSRLFSSNRLVTLTGPGGCGKTRLATEFARNLIQRKSKPDQQFVGGIWMIELSPLSSGELIARAVAAAICKSQTTATAVDRPPMQMVIETIGLQPTAMVLDNCEHLVGPSAEIIRELLSRCPNLRIIATSRAGLGVKGEQIYHVPALSFPAADHVGRTTHADALQFEAVRLFAERAQLARADFAVTNENLAIVADVCQRLEGIPLAIELAAARVRAMPIDQIGERLFEVLDPQRVLESSIKWSVQLLAPAERTLLARLSVFRGGWTLEAAEAVCGDGETKKVRKKPVVDLLASLVDKSLVLYEERDARPRYHMLETVREFAESVLNTQLAAMCTRHMSFFASLVQSVKAAEPVEQADWNRRLDVEGGNLHMALMTCQSGSVDVAHGATLVLALEHYWMLSGQLSIARAWLSWCLTRSNKVDATLQARLFNAAAIVEASSGSLKAAVQLARRALEIVEGLQDASRRTGVLINLALWSRELGELSESRRYCEEARGECHGIVDEPSQTRMTAFIDLLMAGIAKMEAKYDESLELLSNCLPVFERNCDFERIAAVWRHRGQVAMCQRRESDGLKCFQNAFNSLLHIQDRPGIALILNWIAVAQNSLGQLTTAAQLLGASAEIATACNANVPAYDRASVEITLDAMKRSLGSAVLRTFLESGRRMRIDDIRTIALQL